MTVFKIWNNKTEAWVGRGLREVSPLNGGHCWSKLCYARAAISAQGRGVVREDYMIVEFELSERRRHPTMKPETS